RGALAAPGAEPALPPPTDELRFRQPPGPAREGRERPEIVAPFGRGPVAGRAGRILPGPLDPLLHLRLRVQPPGLPRERPGLPEEPRDGGRADGAAEVGRSLRSKV